MVAFSAMKSESDKPRRTSTESRGVELKMQDADVVESATGPGRSSASSSSSSESYAHQHQVSGSTPARGECRSPGEQERPSLRSFPTVLRGPGGTVSPTSDGRSSGNRTPLPSFLQRNTSGPLVRMPSFQPLLSASPFRSKNSGGNSGGPPGNTIAEQDRGAAQNSGGSLLFRPLESRGPLLGSFGGISNSSTGGHVTDSSGGEANLYFPNAASSKDATSTAFFSATSAEEGTPAQSGFSSARSQVTTTSSSRPPSVVYLDQNEDSARNPAPPATRPSNIHAPGPQLSWRPLAGLPPRPPLHTNNNMTNGGGAFSGAFRSFHKNIADNPSGTEAGYCSSDVAYVHPFYGAAEHVHI